MNISNFTNQFFHLVLSISSVDICQRYVTPTHNTLHFMKKWWVSLKSALHTVTSRSQSQGSFMGEYSKPLDEIWGLWERKGWKNEKFDNFRKTDCSIQWSVNSEEACSDPSSSSISDLQPTTRKLDPHQEYFGGLGNLLWARHILLCHCVVDFKKRWH